ncbi:MAG: DUF4240 domain-containing protein [Promethearchaeota archaeon]|jgi:hypothetical protein
MNFKIQRFWNLINDIRDRWDKDDDILQDFYIKELKRLNNDEIIVFHHIFEYLWEKLTDDLDFNDEVYDKKMQFDDDRVRMCWIDTIIIRGEEVYLMALTAPEKFMDYHKQDFDTFHFLLDCYYYIADNAFLEKNGVDIYEGYISRKEEFDLVINEIFREFDEKIAFYRNSQNK